MISVIICSTNPLRLARVKENISQTIGCEHEFVVRDNKGSADGICKVYNELAQESKAEILCFVHEDVKFITPEWAKKICPKVMEPSTGIVGFAGSAVKTKNLSGTHHKHYSECNVIDCKEGEEPKELIRLSLSGMDFGPVVTVDGLCLIMRREVWKEVGGFDQQNFTGFHLYDLDISTAVAIKGLKNYVCHTVEIIHYSKGDYNKQWYENSLIYQNKWEEQLPIYTNRPNDKQIRKDEKYIYFNITYHLLKRTNIHPKTIWPRVKKQLAQYPLYHKSYYILYRFLRYKTSFKTN